MKPYETIQELLEASKIHGPYIIPINVQPKILKCPIEVTDEELHYITDIWNHQNL